MFIALFATDVLDKLRANLVEPWLTLSLSASLSSVSPPAAETSATAAAAAAGSEADSAAGATWELPFSALAVVMASTLELPPAWLCVACAWETGAATAPAWGVLVA